jgi:hypothetical protein
MTPWPVPCSNSRRLWGSTMTSASRGGAPPVHPFAAATKTPRLLRRARAMAWRNLTRMRRVTDAERRRDTRRKIQLGGLIIKAGLAAEEPAVILGLLTAARRALNGQQAAASRQRWKDLGNQAFDNNSP